MATLALSVAGQFVGGLLGGPIGATVGRALGALAGSAVDGMLFGDKGAERPLADVRLGGSSEGAPIPRLYGWGRLSGNIIWAREWLRHSGETAGSKGFGAPEEDEEILASFAVGFCEGPVLRLGRIWADGQLLDTRGLSLRFYSGKATQMPDSLIEAVQGEGNTPAYRGLCYLVLENLPLSRFGNRVPQLSVELCRVVGDLEPAIRAVTVIPGATEFGYDPVPRVRLLGPGEGVSENAHLAAGISNWTWSIDELMDLCPNLNHVALVVSWFGDDLRCGACQVMPRVEAAGREVEGTIWAVAGYGRNDVPVVSSHAGGPAYGGTPSDAAVRAAIADLRARGLEVTLYPLLMMDVPAGNGLPAPYGGSEQAAYPWRGRITCHPQTADGTSAAAAQVSAFVPGYRAMVLHYAQMAAEAGVDALLIGSEMRGMTTIRGPGNSFPFVDALLTLAADVRSVVGPAVKLSYAADWSEYSGHQPGGEKFFHLDPLWASDAIDAVGIDCYMPLADWRDGENHFDAATAATPYDLDYLEGNVAGGEGFDWFYASDADRRDQTRTPIADGAHGEPWVWRYKDIRAFWSQWHFDRPGGVRSATPTAWVPGSKPIWLTELGCGAVDKGANQPNIFGDDKSGEGGRPYFSTGLPDGLMQRQFLRAHMRFWADPDNNPQGMLDPRRIYCWTWDARPFPSFPALEDVWSDGPNHRTGHWLTGRLGALASDELIGAMAADHGVTVAALPAAPLIGGMLVGAPGSVRDAIEPVLELTGQKLLARNGALQGVLRGAVVEIDPETLAVDGAPILARRRSAPAERPGRLALAHFDRERDYLTATATALRPGEGTLDSQSLPIVLDGTAARLAAERLLNGRSTGGDRIELAVPPGQVDLEPGDRIALADLAGGPFEITEIRDGAVRRIEAVAVAPGDAVATGVDRPRSAGVPMVRVAPLVVAAHLPALPEAPLQSRLVVGAHARPWPGTIRLRDGDTDARLADLTRPAALGSVESGIPAGPVGVWDRGATLDVRLLSGHLAGIGDANALGGGNRLAVETEDGWEVIGCAEAELLAPGRYRLWRLLRALDGTRTGVVAAGARALVLDRATATLPVDAQRIGETRSLVAGSGGAESVDVVLLESGPALPLSPVHLRASRQDDGAIRLNWVRRSRADADVWGQAEPPLEHQPEVWRIDIFDGPVRVRSLTSTAPMAVYGAAEQAADFGSLPESCGFSVAQLSPLLGPGHPAEGFFHD